MLRFDLEYPLARQEVLGNTYIRSGHTLRTAMALDAVCCRTRPLTLDATFGPAQSAMTQPVQVLVCFQDQLGMMGKV